MHRRTHTASSLLYNARVVMATVSAIVRFSLSFYLRRFLNGWKGKKNLKERQKIYIYSLSVWHIYKLYSLLVLQSPHPPSCAPFSDPSWNQRHFSGKLPYFIWKFFFSFLLCFFPSLLYDDDDDQFFFLFVWRCCAVSLFPFNAMATVFIFLLPSFQFLHWVILYISIEQKKKKIKHRIRKRQNQRRWFIGWIQIYTKWIKPQTERVEIAHSTLENAGP